LTDCDFDESGGSTALRSRTPKWAAHFEGLIPGCGTCYTGSAMWNPIKDYPLSLFADASHSLLGSLAGFFAAGSLAYLVVVLDPSEGFKGAHVLFAWLYTLMFACIYVYGVPLLMIHFWTLYKLFYTDESRLKFFYVAFATHTIMFVVAVWFEHREEAVGRCVFSVLVLAVLFCLLKKRGVFRREAQTVLY
jgi:hypothetical protein